MILNLLTSLINGARFCVCLNERRKKAFSPEFGFFTPQEVKHYSRIFKGQIFLWLGYRSSRISHKRYRDRSPLFLRCIPDIYRD